MRRSYLLDTSAFQAVPGNRLREASLHSRLLVSPFCFWELLTHLDDEGRFELSKGNLMKLKYVSVLNDPKTSIERDVGPASSDIHQRPADTEFIYATLAALKDSTSVSNFYSKHIRVHSDIRQIAGCVGRICDSLEAEERRFQHYVVEVMTAIRTGRVAVEESADRHQAALQIVNAWSEHFAEKAVDESTARAAAKRRMYIYSSYVLHLAIDCLQRGSETIAKNDFEDSCFCQHLALDAETIAVTGDNGLRRRLQDTIELANSLSDSSFYTNLQVVGTEGFERSC